MMDGLLLLTLGLFMKVVLADGMLASTADTVFSSTDLLPTLDAWTGVLAFSGQIFLDFAGYSTCAIGVALCLGFVLPQNFNYPYAAIGFSDFWRRWHITLSTWLRDYLYIPLGGSRNGKAKMYFALMMTMLLGGLWHGANWTFVVWGGLHGLYLWVEKFFKDRRGVQSDVSTSSNTITNFAYAMLTFMLVNITWVFFRADTFGKSWGMLQSMFGMADGKPLLTTLAIFKVAVIIPLLVLCHWFLRNTKILDVAYKMSWIWLSIFWSAMLLMLIWAQESGSSFIYFQF
jgi:D-alanyl-lipoteichoic acid acyltransferase DltB (MBOAT superfamily)